MNNDIEIKEDGESITFSEETKFDEAQLVEKYRNEMMAARVQETMVKQTPQVVSGMQLHIEMTKTSIQMNNDKQARLKKLFEELKINIPKRIEKLRGKYDENDLMRKAKEMLSTSNTELVKDGDGYIMKTEVSQSIEDLLIEFMGLQDAKPRLLEKLLEQEKSAGGKRDQANRAGQVLEDIHGRMKTIKEFFERKGKDINVLLDQTAQVRNQAAKTANELPEGQNE